MIVKATRLCNLRCSYCHDWSAEPGSTMRFPVLLAMTRAALTDPTHQSVEFIWHGGETTLLPVDFYRRAIVVQYRLRRPGQLVRNVLQTNGTRLTPEWVRFFLDYEVNVGISLDGPPQVHDRHRRDRSGTGSFEQVLTGLQLLREYDVPHGVLMVIGEEALTMGAQAVFDTFVQLGVRNYGLIEVKPDNQPGATPETAHGPYFGQARMTAFLCDYYDCWLAHGDDGIVVRELRSVEGRLRGGSPGTCKLGGPCLGQYYLIEPSGEVAHCDLFKGDPSWTLGSVMSDSFADIRASDRMRALREEDARQRAQMSAQCVDFEVCQGYCPHERYLSRQNNPQHSTRCCGLQPLIEHVRQRMATSDA
ncbi:MAG: radical SAM protein [Jatrophihabitantaceae bacterium]